MAKNITVANTKRRKKGAKKKPRKKRPTTKRRRKGAGQYKTGVPANRMMESNQYWQLRAEIAGGESKVRTSIKERQAAEDKKDDELRRLRVEVGTLKGESRATTATANAALVAASVGTPARTRARADSPSPRTETSIDLSSLSSISAAQSNASDGTYDSGNLHSMSRDAISFGSGASGARGAPSHKREPLSTPVREHLDAVSVEGMTLAQQLAEVSPEDTPKTAKIKERRRGELKGSPPSFVKATDRDAAGAAAQVTGAGWSPTGAIATYHYSPEDTDFE